VGTLIVIGSAAKAKLQNKSNKKPSNETLCLFIDFMMRFGTLFIANQP
jgi:hypothetical protein